MSERYSNLFSLNGALYTEGSPVIIEAGALLKDNVTGKVLAQLKLRNINPNPIKAVSVRFFAKDTAGRTLGDPIVYSYLDLAVSRDKEFAQKTAIPFPDDTTRAFAVEITDVVFANGTLWTTKESDEWKTPAGAQSLDLGEELRKQYQLDICSNAAYAFSEEMGLWYCGCGAVNLVGEVACHRCGTEYKKQKNVDRVLLKKHCEERLAKEEEERKAKEDADRIEAERKAEKERIAAKKRKKIMKIATPIVAACIAFVILLTTVIIPNSKYNNAIAWINDGRYIVAYETLISLNGYKDSVEKAKQIHNQYKQEKLKSAEVGDYLLFGSYEQDNNHANGKEAVEWLVLAKEDNKVLVISRYALDCQQYNTFNENITWEGCSLRKWLNETFFYIAFSTVEKVLIQNTRVSADKNPSYSTFPGKSTTDKVFLLSLLELNRYFSSDNARQCAATEYVYMKRLSKLSSEVSRNKCSWWLRTPGDNTYCYTAVMVYDDGWVWDSGINVTSDTVAVRPAMWIDLDKLKGQ